MRIEAVGKVVRGKRSLGREILTEITNLASAVTAGLRWDGKRLVLRRPGFAKRLYEKTRLRDNFTCQLCGELQIRGGEKLSVHHIDYNKENDDEVNLVSLCRSCHSKTGTNRKYWMGVLGQGD